LVVLKTTVAPVLAQPPLLPTGISEVKAPHLPTTAFTDTVVRPGVGGSLVDGCNRIAQAPFLTRIAIVVLARKASITTTAAPSRVASRASFSPAA
jgi:hypothetical protein